MLSPNLNHKYDKSFIHRCVQWNEANNMIFHILNKVEEEIWKNLKCVSPEALHNHWTWTSKWLKVMINELSLPLVLSTWINHCNMLTIDILPLSDQPKSDTKALNQSCRKKQYVSWTKWNVQPFITIQWGHAF